MCILIQAQLPLDPSRLPTGYGDTEIRDLAPLFKALASGVQVRYRITANASKTLRPTDCLPTLAGGLNFSPLPRSNITPEGVFKSDVQPTT